MTINGRTLSRLSPCIRRACRDDRFYALLAPWSCGAFDGGCLIVAEALRQAIGSGTLYGLWGNRMTRTKYRPGWMHAVLRIGDRYVDGDGVAHKQLLIDRWRKHELVIVTSLQPMPAIEQQGVVNGTPYAPEVIDQMAAFFRERFRIVN